jgi:hypothetical protein
VAAGFGVPARHRYAALGGGPGIAMSLGRVVWVQLACGARVSVTVSVGRAQCASESCDHPTAEEAADLIRLAIMDAELAGSQGPRGRDGRG